MNDKMTEAEANAILERAGVDPIEDVDTGNLLDVIIKLQTRIDAHKKSGKEKIEVHCAQCGCELELIRNYENYPNKLDHLIYVKPCKFCLKHYGGQD